MGSNGHIGEERRKHLFAFFKKFQKGDRQEDQAPQTVSPVLPQPTARPADTHEEETVVPLEETVLSDPSSPPVESDPTFEQEEAREEKSAEGGTEPEPDAPTDPDAPTAAAAKVVLDAKRMEAKVVVSPPKNGGDHITLPQIQQALEAAGVVFGISDTAMKTFVRLRLYQKPFAVAKGKPAVDGVNGRIEYHFAKELEARPSSREDGTVDYKDLQLIQDVPQGAVIADIIPPTPMQKGCDVLGKALSGREGKAAAIKVGCNTVLSEDGTQLLAAQPGNLVWRNDHFEIEETLHIEGSVDNAVGNIVFSGDVVVDGDVCEGYSVESGRNVTVRGFVEGATIIAKGDITIQKGMNGMGKGRIEAGGNINSRFFENSEVYSIGSIEADSILNSRVSSEDKILVRGRRGAIMGGVCNACNRIEAQSIGTDSQIITEIMLGASPEVLGRYKKLQEELEQVERDIDMEEKNLQYLLSLASSGKLSSERRGMLNQKNQDHQKAMEVREDLRDQLQDLETVIENARSGRLAVMTLHPPVHLTMNGILQKILSEERNVSYYFSDGQIKRGTVV